MRQLKFVLPVMLFAVLLCGSFKAIDYTGYNLLLVLGANSSAKEFKPIKDFWMLDKNLQNEYGGIKLISNKGGNVECILIAGENFQQSGVKFSKCTSALPYHILLSDDTAALNMKLGSGQKIMGRNAMKYYQDDVAIEVVYNDLKDGKILWLKLYNEVRPAPQPIIIVEEKKAVTSKTKLEQNRRSLEDKTFLTVPDAQPVKTEAGASAFKKALLSVFSSYKESNFHSIKAGLRSSGNFWKYQYTYTTKLKIPGEKFNMLYSFPFASSPLDFVSVIKESDGYDASFVSAYKELERKLMKDFPAAEGWTSSCIPNKESKTLSDLEFSNDQYGSIVLDYSKSPNGRYILYIRFLLNAG